jgi:hypothetical protein
MPFQITCIVHEWDCNAVFPLILYFAPHFKENLFLIFSFVQKINVQNNTTV